MRENDWILLSDLRTLTKEQYNNFFIYSKLMGVNCNILYDVLGIEHSQDIFIVYKTEWLFSTNDDLDKGTQISLEDVIRMSMLVMYED